MSESMRIEPGLRRVILAELLIPSALLVLGVLAGLLQTLARAGVFDTPKILGMDYYQLLTLHGVVNAIVYTTFFAVAFGHAVIRYFLGRPLNATVGASFWMMLIGTLMAAWAILTGRADVLYTFYPPLKAHPAFYIGAALLVVGSWVAFFGWVPNYLAWRREHPDQKTPLAVVGILATFIVWFIATVPLAVEVLFMLIPWSLGWVREINVMLARTLFWFFGHPLVYFWLLPSYVAFYVFLPRLTGGKLFSDSAGRLAFLLFIVLSAPVGVHHQFGDPAIGTSWKWLQTVITFGVAIPSFITAFTVAASMEMGARTRGGRGLFGWWARLPYLSTESWMFSYFFAGLVLFFFGGITGIINASYSMNNVVHNTAWIPGHFHTTVAGPVLLAFAALTLHMTGTLTGRRIPWKGLVVSVPYLWLVGVLVFSVGLSVAGLDGMPRRTHLGMTYTNPITGLFDPSWRFWSHVSLGGGALMTLSMLCYFLCLFGTAFARKEAEPALAFPVSEVYEDRDVPALRNFTPWLVMAVILLVIAYAPPLYDVLRATTGGAPPYSPTSPAPLP